MLVRRGGVSDEGTGPALGGYRCGQGPPLGCVVDETGATLWSKKVDNDESAILDAIGGILDLAEQVDWAVDISGTSPRCCWPCSRRTASGPKYVPGRTVNRMSGAYRGEAKTDARDAYVIAETRGTAATWHESTCRRRWWPSCGCW